MSTGRERPVPPPPSPGVPKWQVRKAGELGAGRAPCSAPEVRSGRGRAGEACSRPHVPGSLRQGQGRGRGQGRGGFLPWERPAAPSPRLLCALNTVSRPSSPPLARRGRPGPRAPVPALPVLPGRTGAHKPGEARLPRPAHPPEQASSSRAAEGDPPGSGLGPRARVGPSARPRGALPRVRLCFLRPPVSSGPRGRRPKAASSESLLAAGAAPLRKSAGPSPWRSVRPVHRGQETRGWP